MQIEIEKTYTGKVIYWNSEYGFLECPELDTSIFLHSKTISEEISNKINLFDLLTFKIGISSSPRNKGKFFARSVKYKEQGNLKDSKRKIGTIYDWNGRFGFIEYPTDGKKIFLFHTRILYSKSVQNGQLVVFNPIKSNKDNSQLFAYFAYPLSFEKDFEFIKHQYLSYQIPKLKDFIISITQENPELSLKEKLELELINLGFISTGQDYVKLIEIFKIFKSQYDYIPDNNLLSNYISETYLIQLWESSIIDTYNIETIKVYFISANADTKRLIASKVTIQDRETILRTYFDFLLKGKKNEFLNSDIKTLLGIIYRNPETRLENLYEEIKSNLISTLKPQEIIDLWLHDYIDDLTENFIITNFNIGDLNAVKLLSQKKDENGQLKYKELISKLYEQYFIDTSNMKNWDFDLEYPKLVKYLIIFEQEFKERYIDIVNIIRVTLRPYQKFILWVFGIRIEFDVISYIRNNHIGISDYFKLKFILRSINEIETFDIQEFLVLLQINQIGLSEFAAKYKWNELIYPTKIIGIENINSFITDIEDFNEKCIQTIDPLSLSDIIFNSVEKYNEIHLRLWLYVFSDKAHYDYVGYSECFKLLTNDEQREFRRKANERDYEGITEQEITEVTPCKDLYYNSDESITYKAFVENLYFGNGYIKLRVENSEYTEPFIHIYSSTGLNRIPTSHYLNKIMFQIIVKSKSIIETIGLQELFLQIHTGEIEKALGTVIGPGEPRIRKYAYVEDWLLRKQVVEFLNENQIKNIKTTIVNEPKNHYRRLDESSGIDLYEKTELFTIETIQDYGIVWENIDLSEDRATYIFKSSLENHSLQTQKIANAIVSLAQFRSSLLSSKEDELLQIFKNNFGFVASIRKQRGKNKPFSNWLNKLESALIQSIPEMPTFKDLEKLKNWTPEIPHTARINKSEQLKHRKSAIIKEKELDSTDFYGNENRKTQNRKIEKTDIFMDRKIEKRISILNSLKTFNQYFTENLNIK